MAYPISSKHTAHDLRSRGRSYREISNALKIGKGTAHVWTQSIYLDIEAEARLMSVMSNAHIVQRNQISGVEWSEIKR